MCEVSEKIYNEGKAEGIEKGEMVKAKKTALNLAAMGISVDKIATAVEVSVEVVTQWLSKPNMERY